MNVVRFFTGSDEPPQTKQGKIGCCCNYNVKMADLISEAIMDAPFRERFLAEPMGTALLFGFSEADRKEPAKYDARKLRAMVEGRRSHS